MLHHAYEIGVAPTLCACATHKQLSEVLCSPLAAALGPCPPLLLLCDLRPLWQQRCEERTKV